MKQYIDKSTLVAEIKKRIKECDKLADAAADNNLSNTQQANELLIRQYTSLLHFLDTLETKEVDLDNEYTEEVYSHLDGIKDTADRMTSGNFMHNRAAIKFSANTIAKVLELMGLKVQKGE